VSCRECDTRRFWAKVKVAGASDCWLWVGAGDGRYGTARLGGKHVKAHRVAWTLTNGEIPRDMIICHRCDVPACVNPAHLFLGTHQDNTDDKMRKGRNVPPRGVRNRTAKLDDAKVREIRVRYGNGEPVTALAFIYGVDSATMGRAIRGESWKHVGPAGADLIRKDVYGGGR
jgi:hypothetical protein